MYQKLMQNKNPPVDIQLRSKVYIPLLESAKCSLLKTKTKKTIETSQKCQWFPLKYHYKPLAFSCKTITFIFEVCFGHFSNMI